MKLRYTPRALTELDEIVSYITEKSPQGAKRVQARLQAITRLLLQHPYSGYLTSLRRMRRIAAAPYPYLVFYEVTEDEIIIVGIRHTARNPKDMPR